MTTVASTAQELYASLWEAGREEGQAPIFSCKAQAEDIFKKLLITRSQILKSNFLSLAAFVSSNYFPQTISPLCTSSCLQSLSEIKMFQDINCKGIIGLPWCEINSTKTWNV